METKFYQCPVCKLYYKDEEVAQKCEAWCKEHKSCSLELIKFAEEPTEE